MWRLAVTPSGPLVSPSEPLVTPSVVEGSAPLCCCRAVVVALVLLVSACSRAPFERYIAEQRWDDAARAFAADSALMNNEAALYEAGLLYGSPTRSTYDPERARTLLRRLVARFPDSPHRADATDRVALLEELIAARAGVAARQRELEAKIAELTSAIQRMRTASDSVQLQSDALRRNAAKLESDLREREEQLRALRLELRQLKEIDLKGRTPPRRP